MLIGEANAGDRCHYGHCGHRNTDRHLRLSVAAVTTTPCGPMSGEHVFYTSEVRRDAPVMKVATRAGSRREDYKKIKSLSYLLVCYHYFDR
jgi:hypothetical protein